MVRDSRLTATNRRFEDGEDVKQSEFGHEGIAVFKPVALTAEIQCATLTNGLARRMLISVHRRQIGDD